MKVLLAHPKTQHSYKIANILYENNLLLKFFTSYAVSSKVRNMLPSAIKKAVASRVINLPKEYISKDYRVEIEREIVNKILKLNYHNNYYRINELFQKRIPDSIVKKADVVIGFDSTSWELSERARTYNKAFILDRTIGHPSFEKKLYAYIASKYPDWKEHLHLDKNKKHIELENLEQKNANLIVVGGNFVKNNLLELGIQEEKIIVNPYGVDTNHFSLKPTWCPEKVNFLFFGSVIARKGIATLLEAWKKVDAKKAHLTLAGYGTLPKNIILPSNITVLGKIQPEERNELFHKMDVMVFPSLFEGFGQVLIEAALSGLPLISTYNTGGVEIIEDGVNGYLVEAGDEQNLADRMQFFVDNPEKICTMGRSKIDYIKSEFSNEAYAKRWLNILNNFR